MLNGTSGALGVASAGLMVAAIALAHFGSRHPSRRGWRFWVAALALAALAIGLHAAFGDAPWPAAAATTLLLPWPVLTLIGLRRFHARLGLPASERSDWIAMACGCAVVLPAALWPDRPAATMLSSATAMAVQFYAGALLWSSRTTEDAGPMRLLGTTIALAALAPGLAELSGMPALVARSLASAFGLAVMTFTVLTMMSERTERELRESRRRLRVLANTDALTGVPNRRRFNELVERSLRDREAGPALMLLFDVDHFKLINDKLGHAAGDRALRLVGRCMNEALRAGDVAGRLGGDEFVLLLRDLGIEQAIGVASRVVERLQALSPEHHLPCLGLSFGVARLQEGETIDDTLRRADQALYEAKRQGRSRLVSAEGNEDQPVFSESQRLGLTA